MDRRGRGVAVTLYRTELLQRHAISLKRAYRHQILHQACLTIIIAGAIAADLHAPSTIR
jgi:hypothetical protein